MQFVSPVPLPRPSTTAVDGVDTDPQRHQAEGTTQQLHHSACAPHRVQTDQQESQTGRSDRMGSRLGSFYPARSDVTDVSGADANGDVALTMYRPLPGDSDSIPMADGPKDCQENMEPAIVYPTAAPLDNPNPSKEVPALAHNQQTPVSEAAATEASLVATSALVSKAQDDGLPLKTLMEVMDTGNTTSLVADMPAQGMQPCPRLQGVPSQTEAEHTMQDQETDATSDTSQTTSADGPQPGGEIPVLQDKQESEPDNVTEARITEKDAAAAAAAAAADDDDDDDEVDDDAEAETDEDGDDEWWDGDYDSYYYDDAMDRDLETGNQFTDPEPAGEVTAGDGTRPKTSTATGVGQHPSTGPGVQVAAEQPDLLHDEMIARQLAASFAQEDEDGLHDLLALESNEHGYISSSEGFDCPICFDTILPGEGVLLRDCFHTFCMECLSSHIKHCEEAVVKCPHTDGQRSCDGQMQHREIQLLVDEETFERHLNRGLAIARSQVTNNFHCRTPNCLGWCIYEPGSTFFYCQSCDKTNCLNCKTIHTDKSCQEFQEEDADPATQKMMQTMLSKGEAMRCPNCHIFLQRRDGCDWLLCSMCRTEICWVTRGRRWGPKGRHDTSGGCRCKVNGRKCHPSCINCH